MRRWIVALTLILTALVAPALSAQDTPAECPEAADLLPVIIEFATELAAEPLTALEVIYEAVQEVRAKCAGLTFSSEDYGLRPVLGPINIPEGLYRVTATSADYLFIDTEAFTGQCGRNQNYSNGSLIAAQTAASGVQVLFYSAGCEVLFTVASARAPWTLTFEKLR